MANEARLVNRISDPIDFVVADGTGIEKGALLKVTDLRTAALADGINQPPAGIARREKIASDGRTQLAVFFDGVFDVFASGSITVGDKVILAPDIGTYPNHVAAITDANEFTSGSITIGRALETATNTEQFQIQLNIN